VIDFIDDVQVSPNLLFKKTVLLKRDLKMETLEDICLIKKKIHSKNNEINILIL
jgi:hypothetical protein